MIITKTPFRVSFFGGGTDYPEWFTKHGGQILGVTINKYCWIAVRPNTPFGPRFKISYAITECCDKIDDIKHPAVRACLRLLDIQGCEIYHTSDLPARSGIGSSSAFVVGLLNALYTMKKYVADARTLAIEAIYIEREILKETVGYQDQYLCAYGGFNSIRFYKDGEIDLVDVLHQTLQFRYADLNERLMLFYTGVQRTSSDVTSTYINDHYEKVKALQYIQKQAHIGVELLKKGDLDEFGRLLGDAWLMKRSISPFISTPEIDKIYDKGKKAGALGGKLLGGGGGGFFLFYVPIERQKAVRYALEGLIEVPFDFEYSGTQVICHE